MPAELYDEPYYYEIAFSFRDVPAEVDVMEACIHRYSRIPARRVLEMACGPAPHMPEWVRRGYQYVGLDLNPLMLDYARQRAAGPGRSATWIQADMNDFALEEPVDFACVLLGSLFVESTAELLQHLTCVARALRPGGLYLLEWCIQFNWDDPGGDERWSIEREGLRVDVHFEAAGPVDHAAQLRPERLVVEVEEGDRRLRLESLEVNRSIFPQEFLLLLEKSARFEWVGWWNHWDLNTPIEQASTIDRPIVLIRRI